MRGYVHACLRITMSSTKLRTDRSLVLCGIVTFVLFHFFIILRVMFSSTVLLMFSTFCCSCFTLDELIFVVLFYAKALLMFRPLRSSYVLLFMLS